MITIRADDLTGADVIDLLRHHQAEMQAGSPKESCHVFDVHRLRAADVTFWTAWDAETLLGCAALKQLAPDHGEIKSMRTAPAALRRGVGAALLDHLIVSARAAGIERLSLETGSGPLFEPAAALYARFGFTPCPPFADYRPDPFSRFLSRAV
ncbi:GNAT family N-acetyltransferase [Sphingomonas sp. 1P06PA]|uniref:GNAT family N-acetyltransferase n=1 Tax=Sphingomonas sp. 1P06PA TaxID=554121 RepID=UPI0039A78608